MNLFKDGKSPSWVDLRKPSASPATAIRRYHPILPKHLDGHSLPISRIDALAPPLPVMKPVVSAMHAWSCTIISVFAIIILSALAGLYRSGHEEFVGGVADPSPDEGKAVAGTIFTAVIVYAVFLVFCGFQGLLHVRENRRGAIAL
ncbi:hypothetical protein MAC_03041 [Metarhizium acridum CQMa 102]|uniref:Uncharacterized protein n=2 Tax=Metarhizium acridum TaxID=92637 RepID=E9DZJ3_METAQ|nr:uncharacterized protein MAC_03041 [Metarhizium acridum CQMa 102]EFY90925.1 hypothetical protein MAC_03041 [Metarhizium acridum CQMa 102]